MRGVMIKPSIDKFNQWLRQIDRDASLTPMVKIQLFEHFKDEAGIHLIKWSLIMEKQNQNQLPSNMSKLLETGKVDNIVEDIIMG